MNKLLLGLLLVLAIVSCRKEKIGFIEKQNVANEKAALFVQLLPIANSYVVDPTKKTILKTQHNTYIKIPSSAFIDKNGQVIEKSIRLDILELEKISDMIRCQSNTSYNETIINPIVQLEIKGKSNGKDVFLAKDKVLKLLIEKDEPISHTNLYLGNFTTDKGIQWKEDSNNDNLIFSSWDVSAGLVSGFEMTIDRFGWVSLQTKLSNTETTSLSIELPKQFTPSNTAIYSVYKSTHVVVPLFDDPNQHGFYSSLIPKDKEITIFIISKQGNNDYAFLKWETNITEASSIKLEPMMVTFSELLQMLEE